MKQRKVIRDRKLKTLMLAGEPRLENIGGAYINGIYMYVYKRKNGIALVRHEEKEKYGLINRFNQPIIEVKYDFCCYPKRGHIFIMKKGLWGFANDAGKVICPCEFTQIYSFKYGMAIVRKGDKYGLVNKQGKIILKCKYTREDALKQRRKIVHRM